jgi:hypothetical protein
MPSAAIERLEQRRLLTSQRLKHTQDSDFDWTFNGNGYTSDSYQRILEKMDLITGKTTQLNRNGYSVDNFLVNALGRPFLDLEGAGGIGVLDDDKVISLVNDVSADSSQTFVEADDRLFFVASSPIEGDVARMTDGTVEGTKSFKQVGYFFPKTFVGWAKGRAFFIGRDGGSREALCSVAPKDTKARLEYEVPGDLDNTKAISAIRRLGQSFLIGYAGYNEPLNYVLVSDGKAKGFDFGTLKDVRIVQNDESTLTGEDYLFFTDDSAADVLITARTKTLGTQLYSIDQETRRIRRCTNLPKGELLPGIAAISVDAPGVDALDGDRRYLVMDSLPIFSTNTATFDRRQALSSGTYLVDPSTGSFDRLTGALAVKLVTNDEGTFILMEDNSVWKWEPTNNRGVPVASGMFDLETSGNRLVMQVSDGSSYATLRDLNPILFASAFEDQDRDGRFDENEFVRDNVVYVDLNRNGRQDPKEPISQGRQQYRYFDRLSPGTYDVRVKAGDWALPNDSSYRIQRTVGDDQTPAVAAFALTRTTPELWVQVFRDTDEDGIRDSDEFLVENYSYKVDIYIDDNRDKRRDRNSPYAIPANNPDSSYYSIIDHYELAPLDTGSHVVRVIVSRYSNEPTEYRMSVIAIRAGINRLGVGI